MKLHYRPTWRPTELVGFHGVGEALAWIIGEVQRLRNGDRHDPARGFDIDAVSRITEELLALCRQARLITNGVFELSDSR